MQPPPLIMIEPSWWILLRFSKTCEFWGSKPHRHLRFLLLSIILADLLGNRSLLQCIQKVVVCDWWILIQFVCFFVSRFVACDRNCDSLTASINAIVKVAFELQCSRVFEKSSIPDEWYFSPGIGSLEHKIWVLPIGASPMTFGLEVHTVHIIMWQNVWDSIFLPSWSSHCQSTPRTTLAPGKIPLAVIFLLFLRASTSALESTRNRTCSSVSLRSRILIKKRAGDSISQTPL